MVFDIYSDDLVENIEFNDIGYLMALTGSSVVNEYATTKLKTYFGKEGALRLISTEEMKDPTNNPTNGLFSYTDDFINISEVVRDYPNINEVDISSIEHYLNILDAINKEVKSIPLFIKDNDNIIHIIPSDNEQMDVENGFKLMYLGKKLEPKQNS